MPADPDVTDARSDVTPSSSVGKRARKVTSSSAGARPSRLVETAGPQRRVSATSQSSTTQSSSSKKQTTLNTISTSLTNVAAKSGSGGGGSPEMGRRKATTSSRLAVPRGPGRPTRTARPASDGGATTTYHGLRSKLPSAATGSVGAISDSDSGLKTAVLTSFQPRQQSPSSKSTSSTSSGRLMELRVQFGLGHGHVVSADVLSPGTVPVSDKTVDCLPAGQEHCQTSNDSQDQSRSVPDEQQRNYHGVSDSQVHHVSVLDWQNNHQRTADRAEQQQNTDSDQLCFNDKPENRGNVTDGHKVTQTVRLTQQNCRSFTDDQEERETIVKKQSCQQSFPDMTEDSTIVPAGDGSPECGCCDNTQPVVIREDDMTSTYSGVGRTSSYHKSVDADEASCSPELDDVTFQPAATSVVVTTATGSTNSQSATLPGQ